MPMTSQYVSALVANLKERTDFWYFVNRAMVSSKTLF